jgi:hypothetical protein
MTSTTDDRQAGHAGWETPVSALDNAADGAIVDDFPGVCTSALIVRLARRETQID